MITLRLNTTQTNAALKRLKEKAPIAIARALNRANVSARTVQVREMAKDLGGITQAAVKKEVRTYDAKPTNLSARIEVTGAPIPLIEFKAKGPEPSRGRGRGVSYRLGGTKRIPTAFIATMASGHRGVFRRRGKTRLKIDELHGPSLPKVFEKVSPLGLKAGEESLAKNLAHEFKWALQQAATA